MKPSGNKVNLITGEFSAATGTHSNIYSGKNGSQPNTATLAIPPQWTSSGVGSAIPASLLGVVVTTDLGPTTILGATVKATTLPAETTAGSMAAATTVPGTAAGKKNDAADLQANRGAVVGLWILGFLL
ncbi:hypothetical protein FKW77_006508 [Venturia effusa]|uniref:Uncharacterized protein n=1 Tax=Venturia effusa TaxID=50376 RepID=A0A517L7J9_9PEZI|nr:hypothetical protein FKW77_006508 [Venturia effusa]